LRTSRSILRTTVAILPALILAACGQHTEYVRPNTPIAAAWPEPALAEGTRKVQEIGWRDFFLDPRLQALIEAALEHNRDLRVAVARVAESRAMYDAAHADLFPSLTATASESVTGTPSGVFSAGRAYNLSLTTISYEADFWGRVSSLDAAARASFLASKEASRALRASLIANVANLYFSQLELTERVALLQETLESRRRTRDMVQQRRELGAATLLDALQADTAFEAARNELAALQRQLANAQNALAVLIGKPLDGMPEGMSLAAQNVDNNLAAGLPSDVLLTRPDVAAAEQRLIASHANVDAARSAFFPKILLTAGIGLASPALASLFMSANRAWSYQPTITMPLFDAGRTEAGADLAQARKNIAVAEYEKTVQVAFQEVSDLLAARSTLATQRKAVQANATIQRERLRAAQELYQTGMSSYLEVLDAQREALSAQQGLLQIERAQLVTAAQLYKALGGE
jgi:multidrug efflux system outer membrane protein